MRLCPTLITHNSSKQKSNANQNKACPIPVPPGRKRKISQGSSNATMNKNASSGFLGLRILFFPSRPMITTDRVNATIIRQNSPEAPPVGRSGLPKLFCAPYSPKDPRCGSDQAMRHELPNQQRPDVRHLPQTVNFFL